MAGKNIITVSDSAISRIKDIVNSEDKARGVKISVKSSGCSGLGYNFDLVKEDIDRSKVEVIDIGEGSLFIDKEAVLYIIGSQLEYITTDIGSRFIFSNPNAKETCGCGQSFSV